PFQPKPAFNGWHGVQNALLKFVDGACERGDKMWNHAALFGKVVEYFMM
ncbi:MAG: hypothetical protein ACJA2P_001187, partial [Rhodoferax sp.]